jgi:deazaflavin-dependent oxidoreductase (nitroreductase family)
VPATRLNPVLRGLFRAPVYLYRWHCGPLLGRRFMLLVHTGRRTGLHRETVLEVVEYRNEGPEIIVMSAFGPDADWLRNIQATPSADVVIGSRRFAAAHHVLGAEEAIRVIAGYEQRNRLIAPIVRAVLSGLLGWRYVGSEADRRWLAKHLPLIAFHPRPALPGGGRSDT